MRDYFGGWMNFLGSGSLKYKDVHKNGFIKELSLRDDSGETLLSLQNWSGAWRLSWVAKW